MIEVDDYVRMKIAEEAGRKAWGEYLSRRFANDCRPDNPHNKSDICHSEWWTGFTDAMVVWFNDGVDPFADKPEGKL